jgi:hypothetical protein
MNTTSPQLDPTTKRTLALVARVDPRTLDNFLKDPSSVRSLSAHRIRDAMEKWTAEGPPTNQRMIETISALASPKAPRVPQAKCHSRQE